ncbi:protein rep [Salicola sp. Rm-C-2C1-2]|uniref:protein rep n=1 Tax=Salicola sp. Rm-C-2C1-2 TaxID=3141321 RepID=UPI0032E43492
MNRYDDEQNNQKLADLEKRKPFAEDTAKLFLKDANHRKAAVRIQECADNVHTFRSPAKQPINVTWHCKHRHCPICQERFSAQWFIGMKWIVRKMMAEGDRPHWLFLTLTVRNCPVTELRHQIHAMNKAFSRMTNRKAWRHVRGSIRFLEVDRGQDDPETAHPHFHCLLLVTPSMHGGKNYLSQERWAQLWQECLQVHYTPEVDVQRLPPDGQSADLEVLKRVSYSSKPRLHLPEKSWFLEMVQQLRYTQRVTVTGELKSWLNRFKAANQNQCLDALTVDPDQDPSTRYRWDPEQGLYVEV